MTNCLEAAALVQPINRREAFNLRGVAASWIEWMQETLEAMGEAVTEDRAELSKLKPLPTPPDCTVSAPAGGKLRVVLEGETPDS